MDIFWANTFIFLLSVIRANIGYKARSPFLSTPFMFFLLVDFNVFMIVSTDPTNIQGL